MRSGVLLFFCLSFPASLPQNPDLPERIDAEVSRIPGFRADLASPRCDDGEFLRRVMLDLAGHPPNAEETRAFVADAAADKRAVIVDRLLGSERFADFWARRWMGVFFGNYHRIAVSGWEPEEVDRAVDQFRRWLAGRILRDWAWTRTVEDLLIADGVPEGSPALLYKLALDSWPRRPYFEGRAVSHFMGIDLSCTGCHDHPFDSWRFEDGLALSAFSTGRKIRKGARGLEVIEGPEPRNRPIPGDKAFNDLGRSLQRPAFLRRGKPAEGEVLARAFARLMVGRENDQFRTAFVNRIWSWLLGRGIVHPADAFNLRNRPLAPGVLRLLGDAFAANGHSLKVVVRAICATQAYQRRCDSSLGEGRVTFSRGLIRPLSAEQLLQSLDVATLGKPRFDRARAQQLAERLGRSELRSCETAEAIPDVRALAWLADGEEIWSLLRDGPVVKGLSAAPAGAERVRAMFQAALSREPSATEIERYSAFLRGRGEDAVREAYWALLNSTEFLTRH